MSTVRLGDQVSRSILKWQRSIRTDAGRAVRVLDTASAIGSTQTGAEPADVYAILIAVAELAITKDESESNRSSWEALVYAGVVEQLCRKVEDLDLHIEPTEVMDESDRNAMTIDISTKYQFPLEILQSVLAGHETLSAADQNAVSTVKHNWRTISQKLWDEPGRSLLPGPEHVHSRLTYAELCVKLINSDPYALANMYGPNDVTIPVISRLWKHSTSEDDILSNTRALEVLLQSDHPDHASYIREEGAPSAEQLLGHIYLGVSPKPTSSRESQADAIARTASKHLSMGGEVAHHCLNLLLRLCVLALESTDSSLYLAFRNSGALWSSCVGILRKLSSETHEMHDDLVNFTLGFMTNVIHHAMPLDPAQSESLVKVWIEQGFLDALEKNSSLIVDTYAGYYHVANLSVAINQLIKQLVTTSSLRPRLLAQFPRWRIIGALISRDVKAQQEEGEAPDPPEGRAPPEHPIWRHACWQCFVAAQNACFDLQTLCGRRTCGKPGVISCSVCSEVRYCSEDCLNKDKSAHAAACSFMPLVKGDLGAQQTVETSLDSLS